MNRKDPLANVFAGLRPTEDELAKVRAAEGDPTRFVGLLRDLDRKYKVGSLQTLGLDKRIINEQASHPVTQSSSAHRLAGQPGFNVIGQLTAGNKLACDCVVPFAFQGLDVYTDMSGPETSQVDRGMIGAVRWSANEYKVWNPGDTTGTTRVGVWGQMHISFSAQIPQAGRWYLIHPTGDLLIRGHSRVVGHGNATTSYDAKVSVSYFQVLEVGGNLVEMSGGALHYDGCVRQVVQKGRSGIEDQAAFLSCSF